MKYIYGLYSQNQPDTLRYIGQTDNPPRRLREHWSARRPKSNNREWEHRLSEWIVSLVNIPIMKILLPVDDSEADRAEHDAILEAWSKYGTGQILNVNSGIDNRIWFDRITRGPDIRVNAGPASGGNRRPDGQVSRISAKRVVKTLDQEIRAWGLENGYKMGYRGRIPVECLQAYRIANSAT
jgi:hypothetical protein